MGVFDAIIWRQERIVDYEGRQTMRVAEAKHVRDVGLIVRDNQMTATEREKKGREGRTDGGTE